jgi:hypothetical protein
MLRLDAGVAQEVIVCYHGEEVAGGHCIPASFADFGVVDEEGWGEDFAQAVPVLPKECQLIDRESWERWDSYLCIVAITPIEYASSELKVILEGNCFGIAP